MKLSTSDLRRLVKEEISRLSGKSSKSLVSYLKEDAEPSDLNPQEFPLKLSDVLSTTSQEDAMAKVSSGDKDGEVIADDKIDAAADSVPCQDLKPSQSSMNIAKACNFAIAAVLKVKPFPTGPGGDLGAIISSDNHIMDGHHRWIASGMVDPASEVGGFRVEFPAKELIAVLNQITVAVGVKQGKPGSGGFDQFNEAGIKAQLQAFLDKPDDAWAAGGSRENVVKALYTIAGGSADEAATLDAAAKILGNNVSKLTLSVPDGFPARPDMPVISKGKGHLKQAIDLLRSGKVDVAEPKAPDPMKTESFDADGKLITERWKKLAGLLK